MKLKAKKRDAKENSGRIRKTGGIPAILYGHKVPNVSLTIDSKIFSQAYKQAGEVTVMDLEIEGEKSGRNVMIHDVFHNPVSGNIAHIDLYQVNMDEKIKAHVPLVFEGEAGAVKTMNGILMKNIYEIEVEALPRDLPHDIKVDLSKLDALDTSITVADLKVPSSVKIITELNNLVAKVSPPRVEEPEVPAEEMKVDEVKVETEEKKKERDAAKAAEEKKE